jgi:hypothetical protein
MRPRLQTLEGEGAGTVTRYRALKQRLINEFPTDDDLKCEIAGATSVDEIVVAVGISYRAAVYAAAEAAAHNPGNTARLEQADRAASNREAVIIELLDFFKREGAATADVEVRRTGPRQLRVIHRQLADPANNAVHF